MELVNIFFNIKGLLKNDRKLINIINLVEGKLI